MGRFRLVVSLAAPMLWPMNYSMGQFPKDASWIIYAERQPVLILSILILSRIAKISYEHRQAFRQSIAVRRIASKGIHMIQRIPIYQNSTSADVACVILTE